uniref:Uncharacterized protein n=1 Tax=Anguilla anguilla TaxID=7936 RepID=A0A0E9T419_ANGAN
MGYYNMPAEQNQEWAIKLHLLQNILWVPKFFS